MIFQRQWSPEDCHQPVAGELVDRAAIARNDGRRAFDKYGNDLAQPFGSYCCRYVHGVHDVGEQNCHLFVLSRFRRRAHTAAPHSLQNFEFGGNPVPQAAQVISATVTASPRPMPFDPQSRARWPSSGSYRANVDSYDRHLHRAMPTHAAAAT